MVARASTRVGIGIAVSVALLPLLFDGSGVSHAQTGMSRAHLALNNAIDCERRGDYEMAATFFHQAQASQEDLSPAEQKELASGLGRIQAALQARRDGAVLLRKAEDSFRANRIQEANALLKQVTANEQFLTSADKQRYQQLMAQLRPNTVQPAATPGAGGETTPPLIRARAKLQQARALMSKGNYEAAEALAREADALHAQYTNGEDTPRKVLDDLAKARAAARQPDAKELLAAARAALANNDLDRAEQLARQADEASNFWTFHWFGDTPAKVLKDVQAARTRQTIDLANDTLRKHAEVIAQAKEVAQKHAQAVEQAKQQGKETAVAAKDSAPPAARPSEPPRGLFARFRRDNDKNEPARPAAAKAPEGQPAPTPPTNPVETVKGPELPLPAAKGPETAKAPPPPARTSTPPAAAKAPPATPPAAAKAPPATPPAVAKATQPAPKSSTPPPGTSELADAARQRTEAARQHLKDGRKALLERDLKKAEELAKKADALKPELAWWDDTPEKLLADVQRAGGTSSTAVARTPTPARPPAPAASSGGPVVTTAARPTPTSHEAAPPAVQARSDPKAKADPRTLLKQGRDRFAEGKLDEAKDLALRAAADKSARWGLFEDCPEKLINDIQKARVTRDKEESIRVMAEARKVFSQANGDLKKLEEAEQLAYRAERLHGPYSLWDLGDRPRKLLAEIESAKVKARKTVIPPLPGAVQVAQEKDKPESKRPATAPRPAPAVAANTAPEANHVPRPPAPEPVPPTPAPLAQRPTVDPRAAALPPAGQTAQVQPRPPESPSPAPTPPNPLFPPVAPSAPPPEQQVAHQTLMPPIGPTGPPLEMPAIGPASSPPPSIGDDPRLVEARQMLAQARACLQNKDYVKAWNLANQVDRMGLVLRPGEDTPSAVLRDLHAARQREATPQQPALPLPELARQQARQIMADARRLQREGKLIEARARVLEAQKIGAHLGPDDDLPERALLELASLCDKKIDNLQQEALDNAQTGQQDPARFQKAEANLLQARQLASVFGLDLEPIDKNLARVKQLQAQSAAAPQVAAAPAQPPAAPAQPPAVAQTVLPAGAIPMHMQVGVGGTPIAPPPQPRPEATPQQRGLALLQQARLNLRSGDTVTARRLAEEVFAGNYGMRTDAEMVLRQIDTEEFNQRVHLADRSFDAALEAYRRRDFRTCRTILDQIDPRMLRPEKQARLRELAQTAELQPAALGLAGTDRPAATAPATVGPVQPVVDLQPAPPASPADDYARQIAAMQEVAFQQLRDAGIEARNRATELFSAGETDRALDLLRDYLSQLDDQPLDRDKLALLKKPIDHRLQQLKTLKAQKDLEAVQKSATATFHENRYREHVAQEEKNTQVGDLIKQFNELFKQGKYREAELAALKARELDPDNPTADAAIYMVRTQRNLMASRQARDNNREMFTGALNEAENSGPYAGDKNPLVFDLERYNIAKKRDAVGKGIFHHLKSDKEREIERRLDLPITLSFKDMPLRQVIDDLREEMGLNIIPDTKALEEEGISLERPVTLKVESISRKSALNILLRMVHLTYIIKDEVLQITTEKHARGKLVQKSYPVADLVIPIDNYAIPTVANMTQQLSAGDNRNLSLNGATPFMAPPPAVPPPGSDSTGSMADDAAARDYPPNAPAANPLAGNRAPGQTHTVQDMLIKLITNTIEPHSWSDVGGPGTIDYFPIGMALIINQTPDVQEQVAELLDALRRLQDLEVSVEVRMISLEETFYERIGLDFNLNIKTDHYTLPWENQIVTQQFKPPGLINDFSPAGRFVAGLTPAGFPGPNGNQAPFTSDLDIPIRNSSFGMAVPPFGGFPNIPGANGGLSMGLAFLSDIQVFLFMEAAQGDRRTHILQAPKLTLFNGQTATIQIQDFQFFTTQVQVIQVGGQVVFLPQNQPIPLGINLAIQAVVSADRRFVRLNLAPTMTNLASATVPLFPITTFITPVFEGGAQGQPIPFTQFIQQPTFTFVNIQTTVSVPDGGTVLIGGLKLMNEGRNEFGTPILSKVPWLNRLFKNVGYGRDTSSLLFLVTPRIIINFEEEERQTGVVTLPPAGQ